MKITSSSKQIFVLRARLARHLTLLSAAGLTCFLLLLVVLVAAALMALANSWGAIASGHPFASGVWSLTAVISALAAFAVAQVLFSAPARPQGIHLPREAATDLFVLLDGMATHLQVKPVHHVFITHEMGAHIHQRPLWGVMGPLRTCLMIGLPLAHSLSPTQFAAVLAHEMGHLAAQRRGWSGVAGSMRAWWMRTLDRAVDGFPFLAPWLDQKSYRFCVAMLRLARIEEFEADAVAAKLVGHGLLAEALVEINLKSLFLERDYWPHVEAHVETRNSTRSRPALRPYRDMALGVAAGFMHTVSYHAVALEETAAEHSAFHPSLQQRLSALRAVASI